MRFLVVYQSSHQNVVGHYLCYRPNPMPGLKILKDLVDGLNFSKLLDSNGNNLLHALVNPKEARCNDGLRLMETVEFLYSNKINPKSKNNVSNKKSSGKIMVA